jgi:predicted RNase H-like nuclease
MWVEHTEGVVTTPIVIKYMATPVREVMTDGERKRNRAFSGRRPNSVTSVPIREKVYSSFYRLRYGKRDNRHHSKLYYYH